MKNQLVAIEEKSLTDDRLSVVQRSAILNRLRAANGSGDDANFKKLLHSYFTVSGPTISSGWSKASKIESFVQFLETTARELKVEPNDLLDKVTREEGERLLNWLGI